MILQTDFVMFPVSSALTVAGFSSPAVTQVWQAHTERLIAWACRFNNRLFDVTGLKGVDLLTH